MDFDEWNFCYGIILWLGSVIQSLLPQINEPAHAVELLLLIVRHAFGLMWLRIRIQFRDGQAGLFLSVSMAYE